MGSAKFTGELDLADQMRQHFHLPRLDGNEAAYFCGHSLGLQPKQVAEKLEQELDDWANLGVEGHFHARNPWLSYHKALAAPMARIVGAQPDEVVIMNSLSVNLHLALSSFYRPKANRVKVIVEEELFPSDLFAISSQMKIHGIDPKKNIIKASPDKNTGLYNSGQIENLIAENAEDVALVLLGGVNFITGQAFPLQSIAAVCKEQGIMVGYDLAPAAGNIPLSLHDWGVDFAVWCSYKYLNSGPGGPGGLFVHRNRHDDPGNRLEGWWGVREDVRFEMGPEFIPENGVDAWQLSNAPVLSMAACNASLDLFEKAGIININNQNYALAENLKDSIIESDLATFGVKILTGKDHGAHISLLLPVKYREVTEMAKQAGFWIDQRPYHRDENYLVVRIACISLFNHKSELENFIVWLKGFLQKRAR